MFDVYPWARFIFHSSCLVLFLLAFMPMVGL